MAEAGFVKMADEWSSHFDPAVIARDKLELAKRQFVVRLPMAGTIKRYEPVSRKQYGEIPVRLRYLVVTEKFPPYLTFICYRPDSNGRP